MKRTVLAVSVLLVGACGPARSTAPLGASSGGPGTDNSHPADSDAPNPPGGTDEPRKPGGTDEPTNPGGTDEKPAEPAPVPAMVIKAPAGAFVANVKDFGASPESPDNHDAIKKALLAAFANGRYGSPRFVYFPKGTYKICQPFEARTTPGSWSDGWLAGAIFVGEERDSTVLQLCDKAPAFQDPAAPRAVLKTGSESDATSNPAGGGNRAFRHSVINLTIDTGKDNPGAIGIDYVANNRGTIENVTVRSGDGKGVAGLLLTRNWPGPALVKRLRIQGFAAGIRVAHYQYGMTFEHVILENQTEVGIRNTDNVLAFRDLSVKGGVPAIRSEGNHGHVVVLDGKFDGMGRASTAIVANAQVFLRGVAAVGYENLLSKVDGTVLLRELTVNEFASGGARRLGTPRAESLSLPIKETPEFYSAGEADFANVESFGAIKGDGKDDSVAIQKAIDSGKPIVFFPSGSFHIGKTVVLRGAVRKVMGFQSGIQRVSASEGPMFSFEGKAGESIILEHLNMASGGTVVHGGAGTLTLRHLDMARYENSVLGTGDLFLEDVMLGHTKILHPQNVWFRQLNSEFGSEVLLLNHGRVWGFGFKSEGEMTMLEAAAGSQTEIFAMAGYPLRSAGTTPMMRVAQGAKLSCSTQVFGSSKYSILAALEAETLAASATGTGQNVSLLNVGE